MIGNRTLVLASFLGLGLTQACIEVPASGSGWGDPGYGNYPDPIVETRNDRRYDCQELPGRIRLDRNKIAEIDPREHPKARQWYIDDLANARRDLERCRDEGRDREGDWRDERRDERREAEDRERQNREKRIQDCRRNYDRIQFNNGKIREIDPREHPKARQWYIDDNKNAEREISQAGCR